MRKSQITIQSLLEVSNVWREKEGKNEFIQVTVTVLLEIEIYLYRINSVGCRRSEKFSSNSKSDHKGKQGKKRKDGKG